MRSMAETTVLPPPSNDVPDGPPPPHKWDPEKAPFGMTAEGRPKAPNGWTSSAGGRKMIEPRKRARRERPERPESAGSRFASLQGKGTVAQPTPTPGGAPPAVPADVRAANQKIAELYAVPTWNAAARLLLGGKARKIESVAEAKGLRLRTKPTDTLALEKKQEPGVVVATAQLLDLYGDRIPAWVPIVTGLVFPLVEKNAELASILKTLETYKGEPATEGKGEAA